jgi:leucyl/phenylalanyl-tRNA--protein transferase
MLFYIPPRSPGNTFPPSTDALREPNGLLAVGGDLSPERLMSAYQRGIFPWYSDGDPLLWWTPNPRAVLYPASLKISRSLRKRIRSNQFEIRIDTSFDAVVAACAGPRRSESGTWIDNEMAKAYGRLHALGFAHCVEAWEDNELVGGLYGVGVGHVFFGESMFARATDASKVALAHLCSTDVELIDCQLASNHLRSLGAHDIPRHEFEAELSRLCHRPNVFGPGSRPTAYRAPDE